MTSDWLEKQIEQIAAQVPNNEEQCKEMFLASGDIQQSITFINAYNVLTYADFEMTITDFYYLTMRFMNQGVDINETKKALYKLSEVK